LSRQRCGVLCAGTVICDLGKTIDAYPPLDGLAIIDSVTPSTGGSGCNLAVDLRQLGATFPVGLVGVVGDDSYGEFVLAELRACRVDTTGVRVVSGVPTSFTDAMVEREGGRRTFFHHCGANNTLTPDDVDVEHTDARLLHVGAPGLHARMDAPDATGGNGWSRLLARAQAAGLRTNLELATMAPQRQAALARPCLAHLDTVIVNELEAGAVTGIDVTAPTVDGPVEWRALEAMARALVEAGVSTLAVVHFPAGCVAAAPGGRTYRQGAVRVPRSAVRSTTGAGDAFASGVLLGLHDAWPVEECLRLGVASAAACLRDAHTSAGIRPSVECLADADAAGYRSTEG
jgi:sugar/nucleoside kinase (ribokinase family)